MRRFRFIGSCVAFGGLVLPWGACVDNQPAMTAATRDNVVCASGGSSGGSIVRDAGGNVGDASDVPTNGAGGSAGAGGGGGSLVLDAGPPFDPGPPYVAPAHQGNIVHVKNNCGFPLWLQGVGGGATLSPDNLKLNVGDMHDYAVGDWPFAWVTAYLDASQQTMADRAELTMFPTGLVSYRLAYIDGIGLPMDLQAIGSGADCPRVGCDVTEAQVVATCPTSLLAGKRCLSAGAYCSDPANANAPFCHLLDASIATCAQSVAGCGDAARATTADVYECQNSFGDKPDLCAALNRGMVADPTSSDESAYYRAPAHNGYAAWLHAICPGLYAFPYDDVRSSEDAFHACQNSTQLNITFCPAG